MPAGRPIALVFCAASMVLAVGDAAYARPGSSQAACVTPVGWTLPPLTKSQCAAIQQIVKHDQTVSGLLRGRRYSTGAPAPWGNCQGTGILGGVLHIKLATPLTSQDTELPVADFQGGDGGCTGPYTPLRKHYVITSANSLMVFVDLHRHVVAWIIPQPMGAAVPTP